MAGLNPDQHEFGGGPGYGLAQWTDRKRKQGLFNFAQEAGKPVSDMMTQIQYAIKEIKENPHYAKLLKDGSVEELTSAAVYGSHEGPRNPAEEYRRVLGLAKKLYQDRNQGSSKSITIQAPVTQHIHGNDAFEIADRSTRKFYTHLQRTFPGGTSSVVA